MTTTPQFLLSSNILVTDTNPSYPASMQKLPSPFQDFHQTYEDVCSPFPKTLQIDQGTTTKNIIVQRVFRVLAETISSTMIPAMVQAKVTLLNPRFSPLPNCLHQFYLKDNIVTTAFGTAIGPVLTFEAYFPCPQLCLCSFEANHIGLL